MTCAMGSRSLCLDTHLFWDIYAFSVSCLSAGSFSTAFKHESSSNPFISKQQQQNLHPVLVFPFIVKLLRKQMFTDYIPAPVQLIKIRLVPTPPH